MNNAEELHQRDSGAWLMFRPHHTQDFLIHIQHTFGISRLFAQVCAAEILKKEGVVFSADVGWKEFLTSVIFGMCVWLPNGMMSLGVSCVVSSANYAYIFFLDVTIIRVGIYLACSDLHMSAHGCTMSIYVMNSMLIRLRGIIIIIIISFSISPISTEMMTLLNRNISSVNATRISGDVTISILENYVVLIRRCMYR